MPWRRPAVILGSTNDENLQIKEIKGAVSRDLDRVFVGSGEIWMTSNFLKQNRFFKLSFFHNTSLKNLD